MPHRIWALGFAPLSVIAGLSGCGSDPGATGGSSGSGAGGAGSSQGGGAGSNAGAAQGGSGAGTGGTAGSGIAPPGVLGPFTCPPPPYAAAPFAAGATAVRVEGVPPADDFIANERNLVIIEGPVWLGGALYFSQIDNPSGGFSGPGGSAGQSGLPPPGRVLKLSADGTVSVAVDDVGTNGLGLDASGSLIGCSHKTGSVSRFSLARDAPADLVASYMGSRFNSPNDLTFGADGTLYFTDPDYQAPDPKPQTASRAYRIAPGTSEAIPIADNINQPNGITLSPARSTLYVSGTNGVYAYPVLAGGGLGEGVRFAQGVVQSSDGMAVDCAGNLYTTAGQNVIVTGPDGLEIVRISVPGVQSVTNVAFGGTDQTTLYVTALGTGTRSGLFTANSAIPGMPY